MIAAWRVDQSRHAHHCEIQGAHSAGYGKPEDCTCGLSTLLDVVEAAKEIQRTSARTLNETLATQAEWEQAERDFREVLARLEKLA